MLLYGLSSCVSSRLNLYVVCTTSVNDFVLHCVCSSDVVRTGEQANSEHKLGDVDVGIGDAKDVSIMLD